MTIYVEIRCDVCGHAGDGGTKAIPSRLRETLKRMGWKYSRGRDICPKCIEYNRSGI